MSYILEFSKTAIKDIEVHKKSGNKSLLDKIKKLLNELREHLTEGTGQPEMLKHDLKGFYSRGINKKHRLIYSIKEDIVTVYVVSLHSHYGDK